MQRSELLIQRVTDFEGIDKFECGIFILHSSFFILHFLKILQQLFSCECIVLPSLV